MRRILGLVVTAMLANACAADGAHSSGEGAGGSGNQGPTGGSGNAPALSGSGGSIPGAGGQGTLAVATGGASSGGSSAGGSQGGGGATVSAGGGSTADAGAADVDTRDGDAIDAWNGMCSTARWSNVSPGCWSCWCSQCADTLNAATRRSMEIFECMFDEQLLVNNALELLCEVRAGTQECVNGATDDWNKLVAFDVCLMGKATAPAFRACEAECGVHYPGDVCTRYP